MSIVVSFRKSYNALRDENIIVPRVVNQQTMGFDMLCEYLADGSTLTAGDIAAVMKLIETRLPMILGLNSKVVCSPEGLAFRAKVTGSITQSQLHNKLLQRKAENPEADIDVDRDVETSDLSVDDLDTTIAIDIPKKWIHRFKTQAELTRLKKSSSTTGTYDGNDGGTSGDGGSGTTDNP